ncbi:MAG: hypothetical protein EOO88_58840, partial [Pedobacter sp.]
VPTSSVQNTLQGRLPGFFAQQRSGQPGRDASDFYIRGISSLNPDGNRPLIIVDDIEFTYEQLSQINVNEIENISILKDAATTAVYGIKGANGVLVVQTRRGAVGPPKVNLRVETGIQNPSRTPKFANAYETAVLRNEALSNDGLPPDLTPTDLTLFQNGSDPYGHPDINWYEKIFKPKLARIPIKEAGRVSYIGESSSISVLVKPSYNAHANNDTARKVTHLRRLVICLRPTVPAYRA